MLSVLEMHFETNRDRLISCCVSVVFGNAMLGLGLFDDIPNNRKATVKRTFSYPTSVYSTGKNPHMRTALGPHMRTEHSLLAAKMNQF